MNSDQQKIVNDFSDKFGGVKVVESKLQVQLIIVHACAYMEGISFYWLEQLSKHFFHISIGITNNEVDMFISLFKEE